MGKDRPSSPPLISTLSPEDRALWEHVTESVTPLAKETASSAPFSRETQEEQPTSHAKLAPQDRESSDKVPVPASPAQALPVFGPVFGPVLGPVSGPVSGSRPASARPAKSPLTALDPNEVRKLRKGRSGIEARLDLHGLRQHEAHADLRRFLFQAQDRGLKWVLVITGKGGPRPSSVSQSVQTEGFATYDPPGILRRNVPLWLKEPDIRAIVVGYEPAAPHHGGDGALYIQLRKRLRGLEPEVR